MDTSKKNFDGTTSGQPFGQPSVPCFPCPPLTTIKFSGGLIFKRYGFYRPFSKADDLASLGTDICWRETTPGSFDGERLPAYTMDELAHFPAQSVQPPVGPFYDPQELDLFLKTIYRPVDELDTTGFDIID